MENVWIDQYLGIDLQWEIYQEVYGSFEDMNERLRNN
jgi:hypothetical protein